MNAKMIGAVTVVAGALALPLVACGSSTPTASTATTVTTATAPSSTSSSSCTITNGYANWESCWKAEQRQHPTTTTATPTAAPAPAHQNGGLPWWAWLLIVPAGLIGALALWVKLSELNDEQRVRRAEAKVAELEARYPDRFGDDDDDVEDYPEDFDDELDEADMEFLRKATDPAPSASVQPAPPAGGGNLLSSLRNQGGAQ